VVKLVDARALQSLGQPDLGLRQISLLRVLAAEAWECRLSDALMG
jgi:hypothetical protein